ncbi:hypothetical protein H9P43_003719 [Blastocladiella emersonii ATCC 22665]|nr:hypothetical protein H9P43_003719 [Blastocladiella emersonii ATCC 22665]
MPIVASLALPRGWTDPLALPISGLLIGVFGIPHGAADHLVDAWHTAPDGAWPWGRPAFFGGYIAVLVAHVVLWIVSPAAAFAIFLATAVYHFGQGEFEYLGGRDPIAHVLGGDGGGTESRVTSPVLYCSRGLVILSLLVFAQPWHTFPVIEAISGLPMPAADTHSTAVLCTAGVVLGIAQHLALLAHLAHACRGRPATSPFISAQLAKTCGIAALFLTCNAYLAFSLYFGLWHSLEFFLTVTSTLHLPRSRAIAVAVVPLSVPVLAAIPALAAFDSGYSSDPAALWRAFIQVVSVVTTPHVLYLQGFVAARRAMYSVPPRSSPAGEVVADKAERPPRPVVADSIRRNDSGHGAVRQRSAAL